jgi:hypothetical protein
MWYVALSSMFNVLKLKDVSPFICYRGCLMHLSFWQTSTILNKNQSRNKADEIQGTSANIEYI